jgi:hypothetical protein
MMAVGKTGGILTTYSDRFSYSGMVKGVFSAEIKPDLANIKGTDGPATVDQTVKAGAPNPADPAVGDYGVAYTMQTGLTRYAPMQPVPPTKVTAKNPKPMYPTSSVVIAKTRLPIPTQQTTLTQSQTFSVQSRANTVCLNRSSLVLYRSNVLTFYVRLRQRPCLRTIWPSFSTAGRTRRPRSLLVGRVT